MRNDPTNDPLDVIFETPEESLAHYLRAMPEPLWKVFDREFMRRPKEKDAPQQKEG